MKQLTDDKHEKEAYDDYIEVLSWGWTLQYYKVLDPVFEEFPKEECVFVIDVLEMFSCMQRAIKDVDLDKTTVEKHRVKFIGFDGNREVTYLSYTTYLMETERKFSWLECGEMDGKRYFNSHCPMISTYKRQVDRWKMSDDMYRLTVKDVERITNPMPDDEYPE